MRDHYMEEIRYHMTRAANEGDRGHWTSCALSLLRATEQVLKAQASAARPEPDRGERAEPHVVHRQNWRGVCPACRREVIMECVYRRMRNAEMLALSLGTDRSRETEALVHYSAQPFTPVCGVDAPNQRTTAIPAHVTCPACLWKVLALEESRARREEREACMQAVRDAGGDNEDFHIAAIRARGEA